MMIWAPTIVSLATLVFNILFYFFFQSRIQYKYSMKERLYQTSCELLDIVAEMISYDKFDGVPTKIRNYSLRIHLLFKEGIAPPKIEKNLATLFDLAKARKQMTVEDVEEWKEDVRNEARRFRVNMSKYCSGL